MIEAGGEAGFPTELLEAVRAKFAAASAAGHGDDDMAAVRVAFDA